MLPFRRGDPVTSKRTGARGRIIKIEPDEFLRCMMYLVDCSGFSYPIGDKKIANDGCQWWFKAADLLAPGEVNQVPVGV